MNLDEFKTKLSRVPTFPESPVCMNLIDELLSIDTKQVNDKYEYADTLFELMTRLAENYDCVTDSQSRKILDWIDQNWNSDSLKYTDLILSILLNINQEYCENYLSSKLNSESRREIRGMISEAMDEIKSA